MSKSTKAHTDHIRAAREKAVRIATTNADATARDAYEREYVRAFPAIFAEVFRDELGLAPSDNLE
jgi:hypothetical protein